MHLCRILRLSLIMCLLVTAGIFPGCASQPTATLRGHVVQRHSRKKHAAKHAHTFRRATAHHRRAACLARAQYIPVSPATVQRGRVLGPSARRFMAQLFISMPECCTARDLRQNE